MLSSVKRIYREMPDKFWTLVGASFVDRLGGALIFPFFALYITQHFGVGMTEVGTLFAFFAISSIFGGAIGGALTDKYGRKSLIIFSLIMSAASTVVMGLVNDIKVFYLVAILVGILADTGGPAHQAMVADMLPEEKRSTGYAVLRVTANLAVTLGPMIGGLLAGINYLYLFIIDAIMSTITAGLVFFFLPETKPESTHLEKANEPSLLDTIKGYAIVFKDKIYVAFILISTLMVIVYIQMNSTLSVFLRDYRATPPQGFGYILSMNAAMVVLFQFWISRRLDAKRPLLIMAAGSILYAIGFGMYGFVYSFWLFLVAMFIITIGEMMTVPTSQALVASFAPEDMRGRYMAVYGLCWIVPSAVGPLAAGLVMDHLDPNWVWWGSGILAVIAALGFYLMHERAGHKITVSISHDLG
jgi:MFS family permease